VTDTALGRELVTEAAELAASFPGSPPPLREIAERVGIHEIQLRDQLPSEALLVRKRDDTGFVALVRGDRPTTRQRFSLAHEIGHAMLHQRGIASGVACGDPSVERLCDKIAAELVIPRSLFDGAEHPLRLETGIYLAEQCRVSPVTGLLRLVDIETSRVMIGWGNRSRPGGSRKIRVVWSRSPRGIFIPRHAPAPPTLKISTIPIGQTRTIRTTIRLGSLSGDIEIESVRLGDESSHSPSCISVVVPENDGSVQRGR
jgi:hypothetical protein